MELLASCTVEESQKYTGKLVVPSEDGGKPDKVLLNLVIENGDKSDIKRIGGNVKCVTFLGDTVSGFEEESFEDPVNGVFHEVPYADFDVERTPKYHGVVTLVRVPDDYSDMRSLVNICSKRSDVRVIGGNLLAVEGVRVGRYDAGKEKMSPVFNGVYDSFLEVPLADIGSVTELVRKAKKKLDVDSDGKKNRKPKQKSGEPSTKKKVNIFSKSLVDLFDQTEEEEF